MNSNFRQKPKPVREWAVVLHHSLGKYKFRVPPSSIMRIPIDQKDEFTFPESSNRYTVFSRHGNSLKSAKMAREAFEAAREVHRS